MLTQEKGLDLLLDSYKIIVEKSPDTELLIVGRSPLKLSFIEEIRSVNLTGYVKLYDWPPGTRSSISTTRPQHYSARPGMRRPEGCLQGRRMRNPIHFHKGRNVPGVL
jgi:glycosyltransferase involved in cell wall biosynthesis